MARDQYTDTNTAVLVSPEEIKDIRKYVDSLKLTKSQKDRLLRLLDKELKHVLSQQRRHHDNIVRALKRELSRVDRDKQAAVFAAQRDELTGLFRPQSFQVKVLEYLEHEQLDRWAALVFSDMREMNKINDNCGHPCGSKVLQKTAELIVSKALRSEDIGGRFGGDEFVFLLRSLKNSASAERIAQRCKDVLDHYDWSEIHDWLGANRPIMDIGAVVMRLGAEEERREGAHKLLECWLEGSDRLMQVAKAERSTKVKVLRVHVVDGALEIVT